MQQEKYKTAYRKIEFTNIFRKANSVYDKDNKRKAQKYKKHQDEIRRIAEEKKQRAILEN